MPDPATSFAAHAPGGEIARWREWPDERRSLRDPESGAVVHQLTHYPGDSRHRYFTHPGWWDDGRSLVFFSFRDGRTNLFSLNLHDGPITQLTDSPAGAEGVEMGGCAVNPLRPEVYVYIGRAVCAVGLRQPGVRALWRLPEHFRGGTLSATADGRSVCAILCEDAATRARAKAANAASGLQAAWAARPDCRIMKLSLDDGRAECIHQDRQLFGHLNASPTQANMLTFCHEGPWDLVDSRIWGIDAQTGRTWKIRPLDRPGRVGHEYWLSDGVTIGYHGSWPSPEAVAKGVSDQVAWTLGRIRFDNMELEEFTLPAVTGHTHSLDFSLIVGDGHVVRLWRRNGSSLDESRLLCRHESSCKGQSSHPHPVFHPDGRRVLFVSDRTGHANLYLAEIPERVESLPFVKDIPNVKR